ncbi:MAG: hypothetical protein QM728_13125 [Gordonia sp. (in: high G+C Gram-positive bacteria)]|uniref:DUF6779 domain-containing protein n=1 Tax=Gordonia sp. (in: high G+C Gram-positive bacteria) TaxID=84139 RepID=UPI0039E54FF1
MATREGRSARATGQWLVGLLIVLALVASCLMVWSDQLTVPASVAVIAALWAAVLGAIGITRYRRQAELAEARGRDMRLVYELQLEREIAARRQYEMDIEAQIRTEVAAEANEDLQALQAQIVALRASLEAMMGRPLPEERVALPNERLRELASSIPTFEPDDSALAATDFASTAPPPSSGRHGPAPQSGRSEWTEVIPIVEEVDEVEVDAAHYDGPGFDEPAPRQRESRRPSWSSDQTSATWSSDPAPREADTWSPSAPVDPEPEAGGRSRGKSGRGRGQHQSGGISAAELLDQLRREDD